MTKLIADPRKFSPAIIAKAVKALEAGRRREVCASHKTWKQVDVGYRHRLLLKGDGVATLYTHEAMNKIMHRKGYNS